VLTAREQSGNYEFAVESLKDQDRRLDGYDNGHETHASINSPAADQNLGKPAPLKVTLCRYKDDNLVKDEKSLENTDYIAVSHVWGCVEWRTIKGVEGQVRVSREKALFLENQLPRIMGKQWFWMDILCVDQLNEDAKVAVTQYIPVIFRSAQKTFVVQESTGIRQCCEEGTEVLNDFILALKFHHPIQTKGVWNHFTEHPDHVPTTEDGILTRLWPLQEITLSDNLVFIRWEKDPEKADEQMWTNPTPWQVMQLTESVCAIYELASGWIHYGKEDGDFVQNPDDISRFVRAYLIGGPVSRQCSGVMWNHSKNNTDWVHFTSSRVTTNPRDFILAIMPQYHWYKLPPKAKSLTFGELFLDCCLQGQKYDEYLVRPLITDGRATLVDIIANPAPTSDVPTPKCLGDLVKLFLGPRLVTPESARRNRVWVSHPIHVQQVMGVTSSQQAIDIIPGCMMFSEPLWEEYRRFPSLGYEPEETSKQSESSRTAVEPDRLELLTHMYFVKLLSQHPKRKEFKVGWERMEKWLLEDAPGSYIDSLLLLTALISCGLGANAYEWATQKLTTLLINFQDRSLLVLAPNSLMKQYVDGECRFRIIQWNAGVLMMGKSMPHYGGYQAPWEASCYTKCLFPWDVHKLFYLSS
jgi:hypothetical protein